MGHGVAGLALDGSEKTPLRGLPIPIVKKRNVREGGIGLGEVRVERERFLRCGSRLRHGDRRREVRFSSVELGPEKDVAVGEPHVSESGIPYERLFEEPRGAITS